MDNPGPICDLCGHTFAEHDWLARIRSTDQHRTPDGFLISSHVHEQFRCVPRCLPADVQYQVYRALTLAYLWTFAAVRMCSFALSVLGVPDLPVEHAPALLAG
jgi:hypothetical protein